MPSDSTIQTYRYALKHLDEFEDEQLIKNKKAVVKHIMALEQTLGYKQVILSAVMYAISPEPPGLYKEQLEKNRAEINASRKQELPEKRKENFVEWKDLLALKDKAKKELSKEDFLIYMLYTRQPPARANYYDMEVIKAWTEDERDDRNYCIFNDRLNVFVFNNYKCSKVYGQVLVPISPEVADAIRAVHPTADGTLLPSIKTGASLGKRVEAIFQKLIGKKVGIGILRHSFIKDFLSKKRTIKAKKEVAKMMMHSASMQEQYDLISEDEC